MFQSPLWNLKKLLSNSRLKELNMSPLKKPAMHIMVSLITQKVERLALSLESLVTLEPHKATSSIILKDYNTIRLTRPSLNTITKPIKDSNTPICLLANTPADNSILLIHKVFIIYSKIKMDLRFMEPPPPILFPMPMASISIRQHIPRPQSIPVPPTNIPPELPHTHSPNHTKFLAM